MRVPKRSSWLAPCLATLLLTACGGSSGGGGNEGTDDTASSTADSASGGTTDTADTATGGQTDTSDTSVVDTSDTSVVDTSDTSVVDTSDTSVVDTSDTSVVDTSDTSVVDTNDTSVVDTSDTSVVDTSDTSVVDTSDTSVVDTSDTASDTTLACVDVDGDGYGDNCAAGTDCDDSDDAVWAMADGYMDGDGDGYGAGAMTSICTDDGLPSGYAENGDDCDDSDAQVWQLVSGYLDADGDGHGTGMLMSVCSGATLPAGYTDVDNTDCNDNDSALYQNFLGYMDADGDGLGTGAQMSVCSGDTLLAGYSGLYGDCDDSDASVYQNLWGYLDGDGDGYGAGAYMEVCSGETIPSQYVDNNTDCDDSDASVYQNIAAWVDGDGDGHGTGAIIPDVCSGDQLGAGYTTADGSDCDDTNATIWQMVNYFVDNDEDGFGSSSSSVTAVCAGSTVPAGYADNQADCDDANATVNPNATEVTCDNIDNDCNPVTEDNPNLDGDPVALCDGDCNDLDANVYPGNQEVFCNTVDDDCDSTTADNADLDSDGYFTCDSNPAMVDCDDNDAAINPGANEQACDGFDNDCNPATSDGPDADNDGHSLCGGDCDDENPNIWQVIDGYLDSDGDGVGDNGTQLVPICSGAQLPSGYSTTNDDCDDADPAAFIYYNGYFMDADGDGQGDQWARREGCFGQSPPSGWVMNSTDCNDADPSIYLGATEVVADGIDQNCNGVDSCYLDGDGDTQGSMTVVDGSSFNCALDPGVADNNDDCNDADPSIYLGAIEVVADGTDQNCDGADDCYQDADNDGFGTSTVVTDTNTNCFDANDGMAGNTTDCDDSDGTIWQFIDGYPDEDADGYGADGSSLEPVCSGNTLNTANHSATNDDCNDSDPSSWVWTEGWYDGDNDTYGDSAFYISECNDGTLPQHYVGNSGDCDDSNASVYQLISGYTDEDGDAHATDNILVDVCSGASILAGYVADGDQLDNQDCDDNDASVYQYIAGYVDGDGDLWANSGLMDVCSGDTILTGYVADGDQAGTSDCDDGDNTVWQELAGVVDADADMHGDGSGTSQYCSGDTLATGLTLASSALDDSDCDDGDPAVWQLLDAYLDADQDNYGAGRGLTQVCSGAAVAAPYTAAGSITADSDCDDNDASVYQYIAGYVDGDGDLWANSGLMDVCSGDTILTGYVADGDQAGTSDCDDGDNTVWQELAGVVDADADMHGDGSGISQYCSGDTLATGLTLASSALDDSDCDDDDPAVWQLLDAYKDADQDNYGAGSGLTQVCSGDAVVAPYTAAGAITADSDCDDNDASVYQLISSYVDADGDTHGVGSAMDVCSAESVAAGYIAVADAADNTDCNDNNANIWTLWDVYKDDDNDGHGGASTQVCGGSVTPPGFPTTSDDCDDSDATIYTGAPEVVADGIDQNCDNHDDCYVDDDGDTYGSTDVVTDTTDAGCVSSGLADNAADCDDTDADENPTAMWYDDVDGDLEGDINDPGTPECRSDVTDVMNNIDCNDADSTINSLATETVGNDVDENCDTQYLCYNDGDDDGFGASTTGLFDSICSGTTFASLTDDGDCNDTEPLVWQLLAGYPDADGDQYAADTLQDVCSGDQLLGGYLADTSRGIDCDDADAQVYPFAPEIPGDGIDNDCAGDGDQQVNNGAAIFVDGFNGSDTLGNGTMNAPFATIGAGVAAAVSSGKSAVIVSNLASYNEAVSTPVSIYGGYDVNTTTGIWTWTKTTTNSQVTGPTISPFAILVTGNATLSNLDVTGPSARTDTMAVVAQSGASVSLHNCTIDGGNAVATGPGATATSMGVVSTDSPLTLVNCSVLAGSAVTQDTSGAAESARATVAGVVSGGQVLLNGSAVLAADADATIGSAGNSAMTDTYGVTNAFVGGDPAAGGELIVLDSRIEFAQSAITAPTGTTYAYTFGAHWIGSSATITDTMVVDLTGVSLPDGTVLTGIYGGDGSGLNLANNTVVMPAVGGTPIDVVGVYADSITDLVMVNNIVDNSANATSAAVEVTGVTSSWWTNNLLTADVPVDASGPLTIAEVNACGFASCVTAGANQNTATGLDASYMIDEITDAPVDGGIDPMFYGFDVAIDIEGESRPMGAAYDIGADEWQVGL